MMDGAEHVLDDDLEDGGEPGRAKPRKAPNAFRTISEVADDLHIPQHVLRFWETKFPQIKPLKRGGGRRYYRPDDIALLRRISDLLYIQGYTIKGVQRLLREGGGRLSDEIPPPLPDDAADEGLRADEARADEEPQLPMPGLAREAAAPRGARPTRPPARTAGTRSTPAPRVPDRSDTEDGDRGDENEIARLRTLLAHTLAELEQLRALLP